MLFLIYINDMQNCVNNVNLRLFADDANLFLFASDLKVLFNNGNKALDSLRVFFCS